MAVPEPAEKAYMTAKQYVKTVDEDSFDPQRLDLYWRFVAERQRVYVRRTVLGLEAPWTADPILQAEFITNMYRELDPGTQYVLAEILAYEKPVDAVFNVMIYRLMGSQPATHQLITQPVKSFDPDVMITTLREHARELDLKVFGDAYRVASYQDEGGDDKIENVARMFGKFAKQMPEIMRRLKASASTKDAFEVFTGLKGMGEFLAHQITTDLLYGEDPVLPFGDDEWAAAGPGARAGIWALLREDIKPNNLLIVMRWLRENQRDQFAKRDIDFPFIVNDEVEEVELSLCNIQSTLCEYYKYVRLWTGETKGAVRRYVPGGETPTGPGVGLGEEALEALRTVEPSLTPPPPSPEQAAVADVETSEELGLDQVEVRSDGFAYEPQTLSFTAPDGRAVHITINFNFGR